MDPHIQFIYGGVVGLIIVGIVIEYWPFHLSAGIKTELRRNWRIVLREQSKEIKRMNKSLEELYR